MKARKERTLRKAILLNEDSLRSISEIFAGSNSKLTFEVRCADGSTLFPKTVEEVLSLPNTRTRPIRRLDISRDWNAPTRATIEFDADREFEPVTYSLSGQDKEILYLSDQTEQALEAMSQWDTVLSVAGLGVFIVLAATSVVSLLLIMRSSFEFGRLSVNPKVDVRPWVAAISGVILLFVPPTGYVYRKRLFPPVAFAIGDGRIRHERLLAFRKLFGVAFGIAVVSSIVAGLILNWMLN